MNGTNNGNYNFLMLKLMLQLPQALSRAYFSIIICKIYIDVV